MRLNRIVPKGGGLPELKAFRCFFCNEVIVKMASGLLIRVTTVLAKGLKSTSYVVAAHDNDAAMAILCGMIPSDAKTENLGTVAESLLMRLELAPGDFTEV
jgi:hypothetical protein